MSVCGGERPAAGHQGRSVRCERLDGAEVTAGLAELERLLRAQLGAGGTSLLHLTEAGRADLLCGSEALLSALTPSPALSLVTAVVRQQVRTHADGGLTAGALLSGLLRRLLALQLPSWMVRQRLLLVREVCVSALETSAIKLQLEVPQLLAVVNTVLRSKAAVVRLSAAEGRHLSLQLLRAFLLSVPVDETPARMGRVHIQLTTGGEVTESRVLPGLLLRQPVHEDVAAPALRPGRCILVSCAVGTCEPALADTSVSVSADLAQQPLSADRWIAQLSLVDLSSVALLACQRPVHVRVQRWLAARGVLCLERLGEAGAANFSALTSALPVAAASILAEISTELNQLQGGSVPASTLTGSVDAVRRVRLGGDAYVQLERHGGRLQTLLVHYPLPEPHRILLKRQLEAGLYALTSLLSDATVLPGGGCLEAVLHARVCQFASGADQAGRRVASAVCAVLCANAAACAGLAPTAPLHTDATYNHAWRAAWPGAPSGGSSCLCGLVSDGDLPAGAELRQLEPAPLLCYETSQVRTGSGAHNATAGEQFTGAEDQMKLGKAWSETSGGNVRRTAQGYSRFGWDRQGCDNTTRFRDDCEAARPEQPVCAEMLVDSARVKTAAVRTALDACHAILGVDACLFHS